jgi:hypothetical protein
MRGTYVMRGGKLVRKDRAGPPPQAGRILGVGANVISDELGAQLEHHGYADGRRTDSKSTFRQWTKDAGLVEKGNDRERPKRAKTQDVAGDVARALQMCKEGYRPQITRHPGFSGDGWQ